MVSLTGTVVGLQLAPSVHVMEVPPIQETVPAPCARDMESKEAAAVYWRAFPRREERLKSWFFLLVFTMF